MKKSKQKKSTRRWVICVSNNGYSASLERGKVYQALPDASASKHNLARVIDESGESYLFPKRFFRPIRLPPELQRVLRRNASSIS